jgi:hypothetical protein
MQIVLSFDSEDYLTPDAADAEKWWAEELTNRGLRGSFQVVAEMLRSLERRGRHDVIEAFRPHEIGFHTTWHSKPLTDPVGNEVLSLDDGVRRVLQREAEGWADLVRVFGGVPVSYCPPGDSWTPATLLATGALGAKVVADIPIKGFASPFWYCGMLCLTYDMAFDSFMSDDPADEEGFKTRFESLARERRDSVIVIYTHPTRLVTSRFWDAIFFRGANPPPSEWTPAPLHAPVHIQIIKDRCRRLLDWMQGRGDVHFADYATLYARAKPRRDLASILDECGLKPGQEGLLPLRDPPPEALPFDETLRAFQYRWVTYPPGFTGNRLREQMRRLAWTSAPCQLNDAHGEFSPATSS